MRRPASPDAGVAVAAVACAGDCNCGGQVTVDELITGIDIALGKVAVTACVSFDVNADQQVTVDELIGAVSSALNGCPPQTAVERGLVCLAAGDLHDANQAFAEAAAADPHDDRANVYAAFAHLATTLLEDPQCRALAERAGVLITGDSRNICEFDVSVPDVALPAAPRTGEILDTARVVLLPELATARTSLEKVSDGVAIEFDLSGLPSCLQQYTDGTTLKIDGADLFLLRAGIDAADAALNTATAYNVDVGLQAVLDGLTPAAFSAEPNPLVLLFPDRLALGRRLFDDAFGKVGQAIDLAGAQNDAANHLLGILIGEAKEAQRVKRMLELLQQSLTGEVVLPIDVVTGEVVLIDIGILEAERLNLNRFFSGQFSTLRPYLPRSDAAGDFDLGQFPDPTFGNTAPDLTQDKISNFLTGGPACTACDDDSDCNAFGFGDFECAQCTSGCTGDTKRCAPTFSFASCADGMFCAAFGCPGISATASR